MFEHYIGVDLHQAFFQACAVTAAGDRAWEGRFPRTEAGIAALLARCDQRTALAVEASTPTWHFADAVNDRVGELRIVDPVKTKLKAGYAAKTDRLDARRLADALRRESVVGIYFPPVAIRELRELCRFRLAIVHLRTAVIQRLRAVLLRQGLVDRRRLARTPSDAWLEALTLPPRAAASVAGLRRLLTAVRAEATVVDAEVQAAAAADPIAVRLQQIPVNDRVGELRIVDPVKTKLKAGYAAKTDRLDARRLADALRRESVVGIYFPPVAIRELRELCRFRLAIVHLRTAVIQRLRAVLLRQGLVDRRRLARTPSDAWLEALTLPPRAAASVAGLRRLLTAVRAEATVVDAEVQAAAAADPIAVRLQQIPGIGPVLALMIRAEVGDIRRFPTPGHVASYAGVVPRVEASAGHVRHGRITRRGSPWLRWALIEAAMHGTRRTDRIGRWGRRLVVRKGALKARVALARTLCEEVFAHWSAIV